MGHTVFVIGRPPKGEVSPAQLELLRGHVDHRSFRLDWGCEDFRIPATPLDSGDAGQVLIRTEVHQQDSEHTWRDMSQCMALCVLCSKILPDWLWNVEDDWQLWGLSDGFDQNSFWFKAGQAVRVANPDAPHRRYTPDRKLQNQVRFALDSALLAGWKGLLRYDSKTRPKQAPPSRVQRRSDPVATAGPSQSQPLQFGDPEAVAEALRSGDPDVIAQACEAVAFLALYEVTSLVRSLMSHRSASVRVEACRAMAVIGKPEHLNRLEALLADPGPGVAAAALGAIDAITRR